VPSDGFHIGHPRVGRDSGFTAKSLMHPAGEWRGKRNCRRPMCRRGSDIFHFGRHRQLACDRLAEGDGKIELIRTRARRWLQHTQATGSAVAGLLSGASHKIRYPNRIIAGVAPPKVSVNMSTPEPLSFVTCASFEPLKSVVKMPPLLITVARLASCCSSVNHRLGHACTRNYVCGDH